MLKENLSTTWKFDRDGKKMILQRHTCVSSSIHTHHAFGLPYEHCSCWISKRVRGQSESVETVLAMRAAHVSLVLALLQISWQPFWFLHDTSLQNAEPHTGRHECSGAPQALQVAAPSPPHPRHISVVSLAVLLPWLSFQAISCTQLAARLCPAPIWAQLKKRSPASGQAPCRTPCMSLAGGSFQTRLPKYKRESAEIPVVSGQRIMSHWGCGKEGGGENTVSSASCISQRSFAAHVRDACGPRSGTEPVTRPGRLHSTAARTQGSRCCLPGAELAVRSCPAHSPHSCLRQSSARGPHSPVTAPWGEAQARGCLPDTQHLLHSRKGHSLREGNAAQTAYRRG